MTFCMTRIHIDSLIDADIAALKAQIRVTSDTSGGLATRMRAKGLVPIPAETCR